MAHLACTTTHVVLAGGSKIHLLDENGATLTTTDLCPANEGQETKNVADQSNGNASDRQVLALAGFKNEIFLATNRKELIRFQIQNANVKLVEMGRRTLRKQATALAIDSLSQKILVADRAGNVSIFEWDSLLLARRDEEMEEDDDPFADILLGHVSFLTDIKLAGQYVVTSDRDEKIRVSNYPNSYDVHGYFLGHTAYVKGLAVTNDGKSILSVSGDRTVRKWDLETCKCIAKCELDVSPNLICLCVDKLIVTSDKGLWILNSDTLELQSRLDLDGGILSMTSLDNLSSDKAKLLIINRSVPLLSVDLATPEPTAVPAASCDKTAILTWLETCKIDLPPLERGENFGNLDAYLKRKQERLEGGKGDLVPSKKQCEDVRS